ncbi:MAG: acyl carrier protein [Planctomycetota bacterium]|nr:acyl carrier protein [Planctomycetota bacterium]
MATAAKLIELAGKRFKVETSQMTPDQDFFQALNIDSIQALELLSDIEMEFDVEIPDYELQGVVTFDALAALIDKRR